MVEKFTEKGFMLRYSEGENFHESLSEFCTVHRITAATFTGIGHTRALTLSYWNTEWRKYEDRIITEPLEVVSITGNISYFEEKVFIHAHGSFGRNDFSTLSGHVTDLTVGATLEIFLTDLDVTIERVYDEDSGLKLLNI